MLVSKNIRVYMSPEGDSSSNAFIIAIWRKTRPNNNIVPYTNFCVRSILFLTRLGQFLFILKYTCTSDTILICISLASFPDNFQTISFIFNGMISTHLYIFLSPRGSWWIIDAKRLLVDYWCQEAGRKTFRSLCLTASSHKSHVTVERHSCGIRWW